MTKGSLSEFGYEPEDETKESSGSKEVSHTVTAIPRMPSRTGESKMLLSDHGIERPPNTFYISNLGGESRSITARSFIRVE